MNQYHIYEKIGKGKHSVVYKGRKKKTIQYYAVKSVEKSQKARVLQEVRTMHALDHKNILKFYAWYETTNHLWLILEYCVGGDLMSLLRQDVRLPETSIHDFARDMVVALQYLHANSIIYCDIKPSNVLLDENGRLKLGGFGLSRRLSDINKTPVTNLPPAKRGTPCYMAPELFAEGATHSTASDLWSLGCVLYECATGRPPFLNSSFTQLAHDILNSEPAPIQGASPEFSQLLTRLLDKNPATRIKWKELVSHPFWQAPLSPLSLPPEPALDAFIRRYGLAPPPRPPPSPANGAGTADGGPSAAARAAARALRESVDVTRLSRIAVSNLEREGDGGGGDYAAAAPQANGADIVIGSADAELDFEEEARDEAQEEDDGGAGPAGSDDGSVIDQSGGTAAAGDVGVVGVVGSMSSDAAKLGAGRGRAAQQVDAAAGGKPAAAAQQQQVPPQQQQQPYAQQKQQQQLAAEGEAAGGRSATPAAGSQQALPEQPRTPPSISAAGGSGKASAPSAPTTPTAGASADEILSAQALGSSAASSAFGGAAAAAAVGSGSGGPVTVASLIWHPSDLAVKPIVANRRIERLPEPKYDARALPFAPLGLAELLDTDQKDLEAFLTRIYRALAAATPLKDKVNVLTYFETLCGDTTAANVLINSSLTMLFVRMLRNSRAALLRVRLASVLGLLVRHATFIAEELAATQVVEILTEALRDKNERVRRRVMATLGELLFYIATQQQDSGAGSVSDVSAAWGITSATISGVVRLLRPGEDEVCCHYAAKTIENICSQGGEWAAAFSTQEVVSSLVAVLGSSAGDNLKATAASTLARLLRASPALMGGLVDQYGIGVMLAGLSDTSSKVQISAANMLNQLLSTPEHVARARAALATDERPVVAAVMGLLDHSLPLLRAKGILSVVLLCRLSPRWLLECCKQRLVPLMERLQRERDAYTQEAAAQLRIEMAAAVEATCEQIRAELAASGSPAPAAGAAAQQRATARSPMQLQQLQLVLHLVTSPFFRAGTVTPRLLEHLAAFLRAAVAPGAALSGLSDFKATLMHVLEAISQQHELLLQHSAAFLAHLLPAYCAAIATPSESGDVRFFCLRMLSDALGACLSDPDLYDASLSRMSAAAGGAAAGGGQRLGQDGGGSAGGDGSDGDQQGQQQQRGDHGGATDAVDALLRDHVLPLVPSLLAQEDPMPLYALKLLGGVLEVNSGFVGAVQAMGLAPLFFEFLSLEHANNNVHNIRLCRALVMAGGVGGAQLQALGAADKVCAVLQYAHHNNVEPFLEPVLDLCGAIMAGDAREVARGSSQGEVLAVFLQQLPVFMDLCSHPEAPVAVAASQCLAELVSLYPQETAGWVLSNDGAAILAAALRGLHLEGDAAPAPRMQQHVLAAVNAALAADPSVGTSSAELDQLLTALRELESSGEGVVRDAAAAVADLLANAAGR